MYSNMQMLTQDRNTNEPGTHNEHCYFIIDDINVEISQTSFLYVMHLEYFEVYERSSTRIFRWIINCAQKVV